MNKFILILGVYLMSFTGLFRLTSIKISVRETQISSSFQASLEKNVFYLIKEKRPVVDYQAFMDDFTATLDEYSNVSLVFNKYESSPNYIYPIYIYSLTQKLKVHYGLCDDILVLTMELKEK